MIYPRNALKKRHHIRGREMNEQEDSNEWCAALLDTCPSL